MSQQESRAVQPVRSPVAAWALWDCGAAGLSAIVATFVFSVYLTGSVGAGMHGGTTAASWLGRAGAIAGLTIAVLAPAVGVWVESPHRRRVALSVLTGLAVVLTCAMFLIRDNPSYLWAGLVLLAGDGGLLRPGQRPVQRDAAPVVDAGDGRPDLRPGRGSGFPRQRPAAGADLRRIHFRDAVTVRGLLHVPVQDGLYVRTAMLLAAACFAVLALPLLFVAHRLPEAGVVSPPDEHAGWLSQAMGGDQRRSGGATATWSTSWCASALFRDGLTAIFAFGAVLGVNVYGISQADVLVFGVAASVVAAVGAVLGGFVDHRSDPNRSSSGHWSRSSSWRSLLLALSGPLAFWVCGLLLCRVHRPGAVVVARPAAADGEPGQGRGRLRPVHHDRDARCRSSRRGCSPSSSTCSAPSAPAWVGISLVLIAGLLAMLVVRVPPRRAAVPRGTALQP